MSQERPAFREKVRRELEPRKDQRTTVRVPIDEPDREEARASGCEAGAEGPWLVEEAWDVCIELRVDHRADPSLSLDGNNVMIPLSDWRELPKGAV